ncbi:uncharacterized protein LOC107037354 [Diachasma alloeum]|uniref:uncharacterized protein LOC107037354 n=1 Tax=Diachasma alloeum TaxID=454923 RepID=UPI00073823B2|nr:uncharacterized protein LOC107037354 [Diachasma alloeum]
MIDVRLNFKQHAEHLSIKASGVRSSPSCLMPNIGDPKQRRRALLSSVIRSVLTYGIAIWADALQLQESRRRITPVYQLSALRVTSDYRTVSDDAVCVIVGMLPVEELAEERRSLYKRRKSGTLSAAELSADERRKSLQKWQEKSDNSSKGRWTHRLIP